MCPGSLAVFCVKMWESCLVWKVGSDELSSRVSKVLEDVVPSVESMISGWHLHESFQWKCEGERTGNGCVWANRSTNRLTRCGDPQQRVITHSQSSYIREGLIRIRCLVLGWSTRCREAGLSHRLRSHKVPVCPDPPVWYKVRPFNERWPATAILFCVAAPDRRINVKTSPASKHGLTMNVGGAGPWSCLYRSHGNALTKLLPLFKPSSFLLNRASSRRNKPLAFSNSALLYPVNQICSLITFAVSLLRQYFVWLPCFNATSFILWITFSLVY